ncbi:16S rRNA (cytidine1402-2'-O)-methyltransferase [Micromonospora pattaloongensis]|uniref:Ribosomal RNA small subunit methyltransferase I n=1 Tax=Micromonospora pattaloongensis TaxID=405436 RepID=A0A1H3GLT6_9ACTN|nr:16S rRNA (cytidine(1402)-2'-O)-methyltransferase [Micromonospora pattaloongensis]SDY03464.1 16S rRNA (cytidine1402-2'-O)-methyltransferase [Micromonospora pattaloongensis]
MGEKSDTGRLILVGAPLGNPGDASTRLRETLAAADVIAAEDTRRLARLARDLDITLTARIVSYFEGNEERRTPDLVDAIAGGAVVALVTDGGMPSVSDPGYRLVRATLDAGAPVTAAPGPSAVTTALALSGLPCDRFCFEGFLPRSGGARRSRLRELAAEQRTLVFFESPHRVAGALADLAEAFGADRPAALCRELTKTYEEVLRRPLAELAAWAAGGDPRGEITLVVGGAPATPAVRPADDQLRAEVAEREAAGASRRDAIAAVASGYGLRRREVYEVVHAEPR